jgi:hypothetical protein
MSTESYHKDALTAAPFACKCPPAGCEKAGTQCVEIAEPVKLEPAAAVGTAVVACQGVPAVACVTDPSGAFCTVTLTQLVCVSIPVTYGVTVTAGTPSITCSGDTCAC